MYNIYTHIYTCKRVCVYAYIYMYIYMYIYVLSIRYNQYEHGIAEYIFTKQVRVLMRIYVRTYTCIYIY